MGFNHLSWRSRRSEATANLNTRMEPRHIRPSYETNLKCVFLHPVNNTWSHGFITTIEFPAHPQSSAPDVPRGLSIEYADEILDVEIFHYDVETNVMKCRTKDTNLPVLVTIS